MKPAVSFLLVAAVSFLPLSAPWARARGQSGGVASEWDVRTLAQNLGAQAAHLRPVIEQVQPGAMLANGAPQTYIAQWNIAQANLRYLLSSSEAFSKQPERLTLALDTYFRMQALEKMAGSAIEGIRKYQSAALADMLQAAMNENGANRDRLRQYIQDLAAQKEQEFRVADSEAQRCRGMLMRQPPTRSGRK